ncbi:MAG: Eco57I restriction-modification methylase domain-containing protein [Acholeplasmataceae bacterium]|jgi:site-specific DNA-methyltransferase (adenine-specific)
MSDTYSSLYNPDVLSTLANLSSDEVFTPPHIVNQMLDMLPQELFRDKNTKFLDPATKSGVFLREIAKRLLEGLKDQIPDLQERIDHIFHKQIYGMATTEMTSLLSRRSVYCSKYPNSKYSISLFTNPEGNIKYKKMKHVWDGTKCKNCGASKNELDRSTDYENYAYGFIHLEKNEEYLNMKFDVIVGNPPYQLNVGNEGGNSSKARAIYQLFIQQAQKLKPRYLCMITPSRWMTRSVEGISEEWIDSMLKDHSIKIMHDYLDASDIFSGTPPKGGVNYFLWDRAYKGKCQYHLYNNANDNNPTIIYDYLDAKKLGIVLRDTHAIKIIEKIEMIEGKYTSKQEKNFASLVSPKDYFTNKELLTSSWSNYSIDKTTKNNIKYYLNKNIHKIDFAWIKKEDIPKNHQAIPLHKVYITSAGGTGNDEKVIGNAFYGEPNSVCSQTYLTIGYDPIKHNFTANQCTNILTYISTRLFRYLVSIKKKTQNGPRQVYQFVPVIDFNRPWNDEDLYLRYNLSDDEIEYIEKNIKQINLLQE